MGAVKVYIIGAYLYMEFVDNGVIISDLSKEVEVRLLNNSPTTYFIKSDGLGNHNILLSDLQDRDGDSYTQLSWEAFFTQIISSGDAMPYGMAVALGKIGGVEVDTKFGRNSDVDILTAPEDVWEGSGIYSGQPESFTPETVDVFSSLGADDAAGTGARTVEITGLKSTTSTAFESETMALNGTTNVTSVNTWYRVFRVKVLTAGSGGSNAGVITVRPTTTVANVFASVVAGYNQSQVCALTVPAAKTMLIKRMRIAAVRSNGSAGSAEIHFLTRPPGGVFNVSRVFEVQDGSAVDFTFEGGLKLSPGTDWRVRVFSVSDNNTVIEGAIEHFLYDFF